MRSNQEKGSNFEASEFVRLRSVQTWCSQLMRRLPRGRRQPGLGGVSSLAAQQDERTEIQQPLAEDGQRVQTDVTETHLN